MSGERDVEVDMVGGVERVRVLPRFCRLYDLPAVPGLFLAESAPSRETLRAWRNNGTLVMVRIGNSLFVDLHMTFKKNGIRLGVLGS